MLSEAALALEVRINDDSGSVMDSVKLIASDMDGTLLNGKGELDPAFFPLFRELELRGIRFAAASGRQYDGLLRTFAPVADRMLFIAENGAYAAMVAAFGTEAVAEGYYREQVDDILKHYTAAEVATAGIFAAKFLEHKALSDLGIWNSRTENYYYRRIYRMVAEKIMPKIWVVAKQMLHSPQTAIYWGSYLMKVCDDTKSLCMQFESVVTNSTLTFSDIAFLEINPEIAPLLKLSETGNIDWQRMMDNFARIPGNFTHENLRSDLDNLYNTGVGLATAGIANLGDALLQSSSFHDLMGGKVEEIGNLYEHYGSLFEQAEHDISGLLIDMVGGPDNVAGLFNFSNYNLTAWMTDYLDEAMGNYYTQRWYIARSEERRVGKECRSRWSPYH